MGELEAVGALVNVSLVSGWLPAVVECLAVLGPAMKKALELLELEYREG